MTHNPHMVLFFVVSLFLLAIIKPISFKICAHHLDHRAVPVFTSISILLGTLCALPWFMPLFLAGLDRIIQQPFVGVAILLKGILIWLGTIGSQHLKQESLSSSHYILPMALPLAAVVNQFLGEQLTPMEWISLLGLSITGTVFFLAGHIREISEKNRVMYWKLVLLYCAMIIIDHYAVSQSNWFIYLSLSNAILLLICMGRYRTIPHVWKEAFLHKTALMTGFIFLLFEFVKFYPMVTVIPVSMVSMVQAAAIPVVLTLSAIIWQERTWQEQALWGALSMGFLLLQFV